MAVLCGWWRLQGKGRLVELAANGLKIVEHKPPTVPRACLRHLLYPLLLGPHPEQGAIGLGLGGQPLPRCPQPVSKLQPTAVGLLAQAPLSWHATGAGCRPLSPGWQAVGAWRSTYH